jgi:hypothetical protein
MGDVMKTRTWEQRGPHWLTECDWCQHPVWVPVEELPKVEKAGVRCKNCRAAS